MERWNQRTWMSTVALVVWPAPSSAVRVYVVVFCGETCTQWINAGQTGCDCGSSFTDFAFETL